VYGASAITRRSAGGVGILGFARLVEAVRGTVRNPMPRSEVVDKARDLIAPLFGTAIARKLIDTLLAMETVKDVRRLRPRIQKG
jgi:hypothetical protein